MCRPSATLQRAQCHHTECCRCRRSLLLVSQCGRQIPEVGRTLAVASPPARQARVSSLSRGRTGSWTCSWACYAPSRDSGDKVHFLSIVKLPRFSHTRSSTSTHQKACGSCGLSFHARRRVVGRPNPQGKHRESHRESPPRKIYATYQTRQASPARPHRRTQRGSTQRKSL